MYVTPRRSCPPSLLSIAAFLVVVLVNACSVVSNNQNVANANLEINAIQFAPIGKGTNKVAISVRNRTDKPQVFGIHIQADSPNVGPRGAGWGTISFNTLGPLKNKQSVFTFKIHGDVVDDTSIRLKFYNPLSVDKCQYDNYFLKQEYLGADLERRCLDTRPVKPAGTELSHTITERFRQIQDLLRQKEYEGVWNSFTSDFQTTDFLGRLSIFKHEMEREWRPLGWDRSQFVGLDPKEVGTKGNFLILSAALSDAVWTITFASDGGEWKIDNIEGYVNRAELWSNFQDRLLSMMRKCRTPHFDIYYEKDSNAEKDIERIAQERETGYDKICQFLGVSPGIRIRLVFFMDMETKLKETGHEGAGFANGATIVELYNDEEQLDPYHEVTHILAENMGKPPALFVEGLATYMSERMGAPALKNLGGGKSSLYERTRELKEEGDWIPLEELITYVDIGPSWSRPPVSYPESGSFVKFLVDNYGKEKMLQAYKDLKNSKEDDVHQKNRKKLQDIYGKSLDTLIQEWHKCILNN